MSKRIFLLAISPILPRDFTPNFAPHENIRNDIRPFADVGEKVGAGLLLNLRHLTPRRTKLDDARSPRLQPSFSISLAQIRFFYTAIHELRNP